MFNLDKELKCFVEKQKQSWNPEPRAWRFKIAYKEGMDSRPAQCTLYKQTAQCIIWRVLFLIVCHYKRIVVFPSALWDRLTSLFGLAAAEFWSSFQSTAGHGKARTRHSKIESTDTDTVTKTSSAVSHFIPQNQWYLNFAKTNKITGIEFLTSSITVQ